MCLPRRDGFPEINRVKIEYRISLFSVLSRVFFWTGSLKHGGEQSKCVEPTIFTQCFWKTAARV